MTLSLAASAGVWAQVHQEQMQQIAQEERELNAAIAAGEIGVDPAIAEAPPAPAINRGRNAATPGIGSDFIVFGYAQSYGSNTYVDFYPWHALTHIASTFISFDSNGDILNPGSWTGRDSDLLPGGAAEAAGVKVIMTMLNDGFSVSVINAVMTSATARSNLIDQIVALLVADSYSHGVTFDFEPFSWTSGARDGMTIFFAELRSDLDTAGLTNHEISVYGDPTASSTQWDLAGFEPNLDYITYSCYDFATGNTPSAISRFYSSSSIDYLTEVNDFYLDGGFPPEKMVMTISSYSRRWDGTTAYGAIGSNPTAQGFTDGLFDTTVNTSNGGPQTDNYVTDHQAGWHTWNDGTDRVRTWESPEAFEYEIRHVLSNQDYDSVNDGRRLGGVGFWSLMWFAETSSWDPISSTSETKTRYYPQIFQLFEEILSPPGTTQFTVTGFEGLNFRWRDPNEGPDDSGDTDLDSSRAIVSTPGGIGAPASSTNAMQVDFDFENASGNRLFFRHEQLRSNLDTAQNDTNAVIAAFDSTTMLRTQLYTPASYLGRTVRMVVRDGQQELETSGTYTLNATGWREITFDLTGAVTGYTTSEPGYSSGDGNLDTAGGGARDIAFVGFLIEGGAAGAGSVVFDEITYEHRNPGGNDYVINEFRYDNIAAEFVEIYGPAGSIPTGMQLRQFDATDGSVLASYNLSGTIPNDGGGFGFFVVGDPGVSNVDFSTGFTAGTDDLSNLDPSALQLYNTSTGGVYDSVVYEAAGGLDDLIRASTLGVTDEGYPWVGRVGPGSDHTANRYPDGNDTQINFADFSLMAATPGAANGGGLSIPASIDFNSVPAGAFQTFDTFAVTASAVGASGGGNPVYRCVDPTGGGVMSFIGDASLGAGGGGYNVEGEIYIPSAAEPAQAIAIGFCASEGSAFFSAAVDNNSYEDGYWLIYENVAGVGLADGRADHAGTFEFVQASNDNQDGNPVDFLGSATAASVGVTPGQWVPFRLTINPAGPSGQQILAKINGIDVYRGNIPAGGPTSGAFAVGFRENHVGAPVGTEGTWIDTVVINTDNDISALAVPVELSVFGNE